MNPELNKENTRFMEEAIRLARESVSAGGGPFGAVVVKNGEIVGRGANSVTLWNDPTAHAEVVAIREACKNLDSFQINDCELYTSSEPCPMCLGAIYWARPNKVYFGATKEDAREIDFDDAFIYDEIEKEPSSRTIPFVQIMRDESLTAFKDWASKGEKTEY